MSTTLQTGVGPFYVRNEVEYAQNQGWESIDTWEGTELECRAKQSYFVAAGATRITLAPKGDGSWQVRGSFPFNQRTNEANYVNVMELEVNTVLQHWTRSPIYRKKFSDYNSITRDSAKARSTLGIIGDVSRKYMAGQPALVGGKYTYDGTQYNTRELAVQAELSARLNALSTLTASEKGYATYLFENVAYRGVTGFLEYNTVFRRTVTAGSPRAITANFTGAGKIWTTAEIVSWEAIPTDGWFSLPVDSQWHKDRPRVTAVYGQKVQLSYSYTEIKTASALFYEAYNNAVLIDL